MSHTQQVTQQVPATAVPAPQSTVTSFRWLTQTAHASTADRKARSQPHIPTFRAAVALSRLAAGVGLYPGLGLGLPQSSSPEASYPGQPVMDHVKF